MASSAVNLAYVIQITDYDGEEFDKLPGFDKAKLNAMLTMMNFQQIHVQQSDLGKFDKTMMEGFLRNFVLAQFPAEVGNVMVVFTCHGDANGIFTSDGCHFPYSLIEHCIGNETLRGRTKILLYSCGNGYAECDKEKDDYEAKFGKLLCTCAPSRAYWRVFDGHTLQDQVLMHEAVMEYEAFGNFFLNALYEYVQQLAQNGGSRVDLFQLLLDTNGRFVEPSADLRVKRLAQTTHTLTKSAAVTIGGSGMPNDSLRLLMGPDPVLGATEQSVKQQLKELMDVDMKQDRVSAHKFGILSAALHNFNVLSEVLNELYRQRVELADKCVQTEQSNRLRICSSSGQLPTVCRRMLFTP